MAYGIELAVLRWQMVPQDGGLTSYPTATMTSMYEHSIPYLHTAPTYLAQYRTSVAAYAVLSNGDNDLKVPKLHPLPPYRTIPYLSTARACSTAVSAVLRYSTCGIRATARAVLRQSMAVLRNGMFSTALWHERYCAMARAVLRSGTCSTETRA
eukprot:1306665-Rhodomonas_salina.1